MMYFKIISEKYIIIQSKIIKYCRFKNVKTKIHVKKSLPENIKNQKARIYVTNCLFNKEKNTTYNSKCVIN